MHFDTQALFRELSDAIEHPDRPGSEEAITRTSLDLIAAEITDRFPSARVAYLDWGDESGLTVTALIDAAGEHIEDWNADWGDIDIYASNVRSPGLSGGRLTPDPERAPGRSGPYILTISAN